MTKKEIAKLFSGGDFAKIESSLSENIEWNIYENFQKLEGKKSVIEFAENVAQYFQSVTTKFEMFGIIEEDNKIAIYGHAEFIKEGKTVNRVNSCDIYEFDQDEKIIKIHSYCNSNKPNKNGEAENRPE